MKISNQKLYKFISDLLTTGITQSQVIKKLQETYKLPQTTAYRRFNKVKEMITEDFNKYRSHVTAVNFYQLEFLKNQEMNKEKPNNNIVLKIIDLENKMCGTYTEKVLPDYDNKSFQIIIQSPTEKATE